MFRISGRGDESSVNAAAFSFFENNVEQTTATFRIVSGRWVGYYFYFVDGIGGNQAKRFGYVNGVRWFSVDEDAHIFVSSQAHGSVRIYSNRWNVVQHIAYRSAFNHKILAYIV